MNILRPATLVGLVLLLSACSVTVRPGSFDVEGAVGLSNGQFVNERLSLRAYPNSSVVSQEERRGSSETTFETGASLEAVFDHFDRQLAGQGWRRGDLEFRPNKAEAEYHRRGEEIDFELNRHGNSGRYTLEIEFDD